LHIKKVFKYPFKYYPFLYNTHYASKLNFTTPKVRPNYGIHTFKYIASKIWENIPVNIKKFIINCYIFILLCALAAKHQKSEIKFTHPPPRFLVQFLLICILVLSGGRLNYPHLFCANNFLNNYFYEH
jgi:hypothetical protein